MKKMYLAVACVSLLAACQSPPPPAPPVAENVPVLPVAQLDRGVQIVLPDNVLFETGKSDVKPELAGSYLKRVAELAKKSAKIVSVEGHTDNVGSDQYNQKLSLARAETVRNILLEDGVPADRLTVIGYSFSRPVASNATEDGRKFNRRTEVIILEEKLETITHGEPPNSFEVAFSRLKNMVEQGALAPAGSK
jgi:outer membrane protein OmpA-like peptidoglycan-associated protein